MANDIFTNLRMMSQAEDPLAKEWILRGSGGFATAPNPYYNQMQAIRNWLQQRVYNDYPPAQQYYNSAQYKQDMMQGYPTFYY